MITFDEFKKTVYHTEKKIVIPLLHMKLDKFDFMKNGKYLPNKVEDKLLEIYEENKHKLK